MRFREVAHVHVVANRGAVGRRVVGAEDLDMLAPSLRRFDRARDEMRFRLVCLADVAVAIGAGRVEVAQRHVTEGMRLAVPVQHPLDEALGFAIRIDRHLRMIFVDGRGARRAVGRARG